MNENEKINNKRIISIYINLKILKHIYEYYFIFSNNIIFDYFW